MKIVHEKMTRKDLLESGRLVDVSEMARDAGIKLPIAISKGVADILSDIPKHQEKHYTEGGRKWDLLWHLRCKMFRSDNDTHWSFYLVMPTESDRKVNREFRAAKTEDVLGKEVLTIQIPNELW